MIVMDRLAFRAAYPPSAGQRRHRILGRGGYGVVLEGVEAAGGRPVAIKLVKLDAPDLKKSYIVAEWENSRVDVGGSQAHTNQSKASEHILRLEKMIRVPGEGLYFVMEKGVESLDDAITRGWRAGRRPGQLYFNRVTRWFLDLLVALTALHDARIVHQDVTPSNIIVCDGGQVKLADFGMSCNIERHYLPCFDRRAGKDGFFDPETVNFLNAGNSAASDLYSLGATMFYAYTGRKLEFRHENGIAAWNTAFKDTGLIGRSPVLPHPCIEVLRNLTYPKHVTGKGLRNGRRNIEKLDTHLFGPRRGRPQ